MTSGRMGPTARMLLLPYLVAFPPQTFLDVHGMLEDCLPFLPKLDEDQEDEPTADQTQAFSVERSDETVNETGIEFDNETFSMLLTGDCSVEFPI